MVNLANYIITTGTFDPPTQAGHLQSFIQTHKATGKNIMVLPNYNPGKKTPFASFSQRVSMLKKMFQDYPFIHVRLLQKRKDDVLSQIENPTYKYGEMFKTVLRENKLPRGKKLGILAGEDMARYVLKTLKDCDLSEQMDIYIARRPGYEIPAQVIDEYTKSGVEIKFLPEISDASSSAVRKALQEGTSLKKIKELSGSVATYMRKHHIARKIIG